MIEDFGYCKAGENKKDRIAALQFCALKNESGVEELRESLDRLEPGGGRGKVQVGYTIGVNLLTFKQDSSPHFFDRYTQALATIDRPVVLYLFANHFAASTMRQPLGRASLARFADQSVPTEKYFGGGISAITLNMSEQLEVNRLRLHALKMVGQWYRSLPASSQQRIIGITLAGELHHFYDDFSGGMGRFDKIRVSDYSPSSVQAFQAWLRTRYVDMARLNQVLGTRYKDFAQVQPPSVNQLRKKRKTPLSSALISQHFDSFAHGWLPIEGWLDKLPAGHTIKVYVDGKVVGQAEYGLSRQDVYGAVETIKQAQVGFRYRLDFSSLSQGKHTVQVAVEGPQGYLLGQREVMVAQGPTAQAVATPPLPAFKPAPSEVRFWLDRPDNQLTVVYNPLARDWLAFRESQVSAAYDTWYDWAVKNGLPGERLFSHQIAAALFGGWNPVLFASDASIQGPHRYKKGINLYGGGASTELLRRHYLQAGEPFGVPELHTQAWKDPTAPLRVLRDLQKGGAVFVTPYFLSMTPDKLKIKLNGHDKFRLSPDNKDYGSNDFYQAIVELAKE